MGLLFAFFLIGLPLAAGVAELLLMTGKIKNDEWSAKIGGYTPRLAVQTAHPGSDAAVPNPVTTPTAPIPSHEASI